MSAPPRRSQTGRTVTLLVLGVLVLTVCATLYVFFTRHSAPPIMGGAIHSDEEVARLAAETRQLTTVLTILLASALLILLFVLGAYLVISVGRFVARHPVGGRPTAYVDAWRQYRLTERQISDATAEDAADQESGGGHDDTETPPNDTDPDNPPSES